MDSSRGPVYTLKLSCRVPCTSLLQEKCRKVEKVEKCRKNVERMGLGFVFFVGLIQFEPLVLVLHVNNRANFEQS